MMIFFLAAAMTVAMLIATAVGIHFEAQRVRMDDRDDRLTWFGWSLNGKDRHIARPH
jgi:hypothetical protein